MLTGPMIAWIVIILVFYFFVKACAAADKINQQSNGYRVGKYYEIFEDPDAVINRRYVVYRNDERLLGYDTIKQAVDSIKTSTKIYNATNGVFKKTTWRVDDVTYDVKTFRVYNNGFDSVLYEIERYNIVYE